MPVDVAVGTARGPEPGPDASRTKARRNRRLHLVASYAVLTFAAVVIVLPLYITVVNSLLEEGQIAQQPPPFFPFHPQWHNYSTAWSQGHLGFYMRNSLIMTAAIVVGQLVTSILAGYAFAFLR